MLQRTNIWLSQGEPLQLIRYSGRWASGIFKKDFPTPFLPTGPQGYNAIPEPGNPRGYLTMMYPKAALLGAISPLMHPEPESLTWFYLGDD